MACQLTSGHGQLNVRISLHLVSLMSRSAGTFLDPRDLGGHHGYQGGGGWYRCEGPMIVTGEEPAFSNDTGTLIHL